jgi:exopolyphosphatase / guanosine-5'-triphosphate,3'-diphosphate pyrophosphatase
MNSRVAILDLGTNTFHLLIAEKSTPTYTILHRERMAVRLGRGGINNDTILPDALERALAALATFRKIIEHWQVEKIYGFGTSALRNARNGKAIVEEIHSRTGIHVEIISGEQEAQLIYQGVNLALKLGDEPALVVDIGGGSIEFIIGTGKEIYWKQSFEIGGQRLIEKFTISDPITSTEIELLNQYFEQTLKPLTEALRIHNPHTLGGSSGTFDTLSDLYCAQHNLTKGKHDAETSFSLTAFEPIYRDLISKNRKERLQMAGMLELRVDLIVVGCCLVNFLLTRYSFKTLRVSSYSLQEGALVSLLNQPIEHSL